MSDLNQNLFVDICMEEVKGTLAAQRKLPVLGEIRENMLGEIARMLIQFEHGGNDPITLLIDSNGGDLSAAFHFKDVIDSLNVQVNGVVIGTAGSCGLDILQMCDRRLSLPHANFFAHFNSGSKEITFDVTEISEKDIRYILEESLFYKRSREDLYVERSKLNKDEVQELFRRGERFSARPTPEQMLDWGLIDEVATNYKLFGEDWINKESSNKDK